MYGKSNFNSQAEEQWSYVERAGAATVTNDLPKVTNDLAKVVTRLTLVVGRLTLVVVRLPLVVTRHTLVVTRLTKVVVRHTKSLWVVNSIIVLSIGLLFCHGAC